MESYQPEMIQQQPGVIQIFLDGVEIFTTEDGNPHSAGRRRKLLYF